MSGDGELSVWCAKRTLLAHVQRPHRRGYWGTVKLDVLDGAAVVLEVLDDLGVHKSHDIGYGDDRLDFRLLAGHVVGQSWRGAAVCVVGGGHPVLLDHDVVLGRAFLQGLQHIGGDAGSRGDGCAGRLEQQAADGG